MAGRRFPSSAVGRDCRKPQCGEGGLCFAKDPRENYCTRWTMNKDESFLGYASSTSHPSIDQVMKFCVKKLSIWRHPSGPCRTGVSWLTFRQILLLNPQQCHPLFAASVSSVRAPASLKFLSVMTQRVLARTRLIPWKNMGKWPSYCFCSCSS